MRIQKSVIARSGDRLPTQVLADPATKARIVSDGLSCLIEHAEDAGLSIIAQHLHRAYVLSEKVATSGEVRSKSARPCENRPERTGMDATLPRSTIPRRPRLTRAIRSEVG